MRPHTAGLLFLALTAAPSLALAAGGGWDPAAGEWGKVDARDVRIMTWNVEDGIRTTEPKTFAFNQWSALVQIVASLQPDVLIMQEVGDNNCFNCGNSVSEVTTVLDLFLHGGTDPFLGGAVTSYVQLFAPSYDLPFVYVGSVTDGFNRNVILSRFPFADLNGDGRSKLGDTPFVQSHAYAAGGNGGLRGFVHVEIDLPDGAYAGDLVVGNSHLKAGGGGSNHTQRVDAASNIAYFLDYLYNGAGTGVPDPNNKISDVPAATSILGQHTAIVTGGDWNEDEATNGTKGPAEWITCAEFCDSQSGSDGTDRDRSDMLHDDAREFFTSNRATRSSSKLDYIAWQDSVASERISFIFNSSPVPLSSMPAELNTFPLNPKSASGEASDHFPVIIDLILPASAPVAYCTAGTSASGCQALIAATGTPSSTAASGFDLSVSAVEGSKDGLFFFGSNGRQANSWGFGTSYQCVVPPVRRGGLLVSAGTPGACDGSFSQDLNALWCPTCPKPSKNPGAGAVVQAQLWYRDPQNTSNQTTSLSNAIEFAVQP